MAKTNGNAVEREVIVERISINRLPEASLRGQIDYFRRAACRNTAHNIKAKIVDSKREETVIDGKQRYRYKIKMKVRKERYRDVTAANAQLANAINNVENAARTKQWVLVRSPDDSVDSIKDLTPKDIQVLSSGEFRLPALSPTNRTTYFDGIFERDAHINLLYRVVKRGIETNLESRSHVLLYGPPACAKTSVFLAFKDFLEKTQKYYRDDGNYHEVLSILDATTLTKAGLETWIMERAPKVNEPNKLPKILCIEEIEKHNPENLLCMLSIMDARGSIMRTNARIGQVVAKAKMLIWATCNDDEKLKAFHRGALWSRFQHRYECHRPTRELMHKILLREIEKTGGNPEWAEPALKIGYDYIPAWTGEQPDPRQCIAMLDGQEGLVDGSFFKDLLQVYKGTINIRAEEIAALEKAHHRRYTKWE